jgi:AcrR family transcriptional regulator
MYHIKNDQRAIRSAEMIYAGLAALIRSKPFTAITVKEVVEAAQVGRTTFYRNFDDIEDVLRMRCDQVFDGLVAYLHDYRGGQRQASGIKLLKPVLRYFAVHSELIELLMLADRVDIVQESFRKVVEPFKRMFISVYNVEAAYVDYIFAMRIGGITNVLTLWIQTGKQQTSDDLADKLGAMVENIVTLDQFL